MIHGDHSLPLLRDFAEALEGLYVPHHGAVAPAPRLLQFNEDLARRLGLDADRLRVGSERILLGQELPDSARPIAQAYAGHQFGVFNPQLGDGRALLLGEVRDPQGCLWDLQLKGSGRTPFSRGGDGKAALGPMLREYLMGEAMYSLGIPSTRALAVLATGETVQREEPLPGAILVRVAASHIRVGTFQFVAVREQYDLLRLLADYTIARHYADLLAFTGKERYLAFLRAVQERQARLLAQWMGIGFIHGVMNTDNMSIAGETIDYGPCAFLDRYDPATVFSSIDLNGRYAYGQQPRIAHWNLVRLGECLVPLVDADDPEQAVAELSAVLQEFPDQYRLAWRKIFGAKLGLADPGPEDDDLIEEFLQLLKQDGADFTLAFRSLGAYLQELPPAQAATLGIPPVWPSWQGWLTRWRQRLGLARSPSQIGQAMDQVNPLYIPRNHQVEMALAAASRANDWQPWQRLLAVLRDPYTARPELLPYTEPMPADLGPYRTFCGT